MGQVIAFTRPFELSPLVRELLEIVSVPKLDPHSLSTAELREIVRTHPSYCACGFCEELVLREMEEPI